MIRILVSIAIVCLLMPGFELSRHASFNVAYGQEDWRADFDDICGQTQDAMSLTKAELQSLIERCDKLRPLIEKLDASSAKVYLKRLQMCRDLYAYVLESLSR